MKRFGRGRTVRRVAGQMNKTEAKYSELLEQRQISGEILWFKFEGLKLRLADKTFYTPDFVLMLSNGEIELHEVKGFWESAARVKIKVAAETFPFRFVAISWKKKAWSFEEF